MEDKTILFVDLKNSTRTQFSFMPDVLEVIKQLPTSAIDQNTWGDAYFAAFDSAADAVDHALKVRDALRFFDWRGVGLRAAPLVRTGIASGPVSWKTDFIDNLRRRLTGEVFVDAARLEPCVTPGEVWTTDEVANMARRGSSKFYFEKLPDVLLPKNRGLLPTNRARWQSERIWVEEGIVLPLIDDQHVGRVEALRRFAFLWMLLDQLPAGSWGRSASTWMNQVWHDIPTIPHNALLEDEGGFETTILNLHLLLDVMGKSFQFTKVCSNALSYLFHRHDAHGFGTMSLSRHGAQIEPQARHTALAAWFFATAGKFHDQAEDLFRMSATALLAGDHNTTRREFVDDRHPFLLYLALCQVSRLINSDEWSHVFTGVERKRMSQTWQYCEHELRAKALSAEYSDRAAGPNHLIDLRANLSPLIVPYGGFVRMESYSLLASISLFDVTLPAQVKNRIGQGIAFIASKYLSHYGAAENRYSHDPLRPFPTHEGKMRCRGVLPHFSGMQTSPDLGSTALLYRALRTPALKDLISEHWIHKNVPPDEARYFLEEDLVHQFDRYLVSPDLFSLTHAGMLASILADDDKRLIEDLRVEFLSMIEEPATSLDLGVETVNRVLSEKALSALVEKHVGTDPNVEPTALQIATHSLTRLLVDRVRPGRYVQETHLSQDAVRSISASTLAVYDSPAFIKRFEYTWRQAIDQTILAPFLSMLAPGPARILDIGCGPGQYAEEMVKAGHVVDLLDASRETLVVAAERLEKLGKTPKVFHCDLTDADERSRAIGSEQYDAIWCCGAFVHLPRTVWPQVLEWFRKHLLTDTGLLFLNVMYDNPCLFSKDGRYFAYVRASSEFEEILSRTGFVVSHVLRKKIDRNTYGEPMLQTSWANFYAKPSRQADHDLGALATSLTCSAYERSFRIFADRHSGQEARHRYFEDLVAILLAHLGNPVNTSVLDVGCGSGDMLRLLAKAGCRATGVDLSENMIAAARATNDQVNPQPKIEIADMCALPGDWRGGFDGLFCITALQHQPVKSGRFQAALNEFSRVLKPGGIARIDVRIARDSGFDPDLRFIQAFPDESEVIRYVREAGFELVSAPHRSTLGSGLNSFRRHVPLTFADFWLKKQ